MPNYCFNGININFKEDDTCNIDRSEIIDDIDFHLRNPIFDRYNEIWNKIKDNPYTKPVDGKYHKFYLETFTDREHAKLVKYPLDDNDTNTMISFDNIIEEPKEYPDDDRSAWYWWRNENWGTKWDGFDDDTVVKTNVDLFISGCTAWSPCQPVVKKISELYPEVHIRHEYDEGGMAFCGVDEYENGKQTSEITERDYKSYRHAVKELELDDNLLYTCVNCGELEYDFEIDDSGDYECYDCGSKIFKHDSGYYAETHDGETLYGRDLNDITHNIEDVL